MSYEQWFKGLDFRYLIGAFVLVLALLLGGQALYHRVAVVSPLEKKLESVPGVEEVTISAQNGQTLLLVRLGDVEDLSETFPALTEVARENLGQNFTFKFVDNRDRLLRRALREMNLSLQEALMRGNFQEMAAVWERKARSVGAEECQVWLDRDFLYLKLRHGRHFLYELFPRAVSPAPAASPPVPPSPSPAVSPPLT